MTKTDQVKAIVNPTEVVERPDGFVVVRNGIDLARPFQDRAVAEAYASHVISLGILSADEPQ